MSKIIDGNVNHIDLKSRFVIQTDYKGQSQTHYITPQKDGKAIIISAENDGKRKIIQKVENPFNPTEKQSDRWAEEVISGKLKFMYDIITPAQQDRDRRFLEHIKRSIPILEYANMLGYTPVKKGSYFMLKEADSVRINTESNQFKRYSKTDLQGHVLGGSIIDFAIEFDPTIHDKSEAISKLSRMINFNDSMPLPVAVEPKPKKSVPFVLPKQNDTLEHVKAYLIKTRAIKKEIVQEFIDRKLLYEDTHRNCVFVSYDDTGKATFANHRGTNTFHRFQLDVKGSDYDHCFFINNHANSLVVSEATIDIMSVMQIMQRHGKNLLDYDYQALSGTGKLLAVFNVLEEHPEIKTLILALDNDSHGLDAMQKVKDGLVERNWSGKVIDYIAPNEKDWNEEETARRDRYFVQKQSQQDQQPKAKANEVTNDRGRELEIER